jgi:glycosyltransferase involved in cell wall biosynthesis
MTAAELAAVAAGPAHRAPVVATRHFAQTRGSSAPARVVGRVLTRQLAAQLAVSRFVADSIEGTSVVAHPGTPDVGDGPGGPDRERLVLVAQRLEPEKRTDLALDAWRRSGLSADGWRLVVAGAGQELARLQAQAERLGVAGSVDFLGARSDVDALLRRAAILLAPRPDEAFGLSVVEAMAAGLPVVAAAGGGHLETVGAVEGAAVYEPFDTGQAGRLLADLAADPDRRTAYGAALQAAQRERFSVGRHVDATLDLYESVRS